MADTDCIFCKIVNKEIPSQLAHEDAVCLAFHDIHPQAPAHLLIVPKKHANNVLACASEDAQMLGHLQLVAARLARQLGIAESGFRLVLNANRDGGQSVDHLHLHLLGGRRMSWPPG